MRHSLSSVHILLALLALVVIPQRFAGAISVTFRKVVETGTIIPGLGVQVNRIMQYPAIDGSTVAFGISAPESGIYTYNLTSKTFAKVADKTDAVPGLGGTFVGFADSQIFVSQEKVAFHGTTNAKPSKPGTFDKQGIYLRAAEGIIRVADETISVPGGIGKFLNGTNNLCSVDGNIVTFSGRNSSRSGIYKYDNATNTRLSIVDTNSVVPGTSKKFKKFGASVFGECSFRGARGAFRSAEPEGIYKVVGTATSKIFDVTDVVPGTNVKFSGFDGATVTFDGTRTAFQGVKQDGTRGIYASGPTGLLKIADYSTQVPSAPAGVKFTLFPFLLSTNDGAVAFVGQVPSPADTLGAQGIYIGAPGGQPDKVVNGKDALDGHVVSQVVISAQALRSSRLVFYVRSVTPNKPMWEAVYVATLRPGSH